MLKRLDGVARLWSFHQVAHRRARCHVKPRALLAEIASPRRDGRQLTRDSRPRRIK